MTTDKLVRVPDAWRQADLAALAVQRATDAAAVAAAGQDPATCFLWLHSAAKSAEILAKHLADAAATMSEQSGS